MPVTFKPPGLRTTKISPKPITPTGSELQRTQEESNQGLRGNVTFLSIREKQGKKSSLHWTLKTFLMPWRNHKRGLGRQYLVSGGTL